MKVFLLLMLGVTLISGRSPYKSIHDVISYKKFLDESRYGTLQEPLNADIGNIQSEWERSGKFEGDIILSEEQKNQLLGQFIGQKNALLGGNLWPNKTLNYAFADGYFKNSQISAINDGMTYISKISCIVFKEVEPSPDTDHVIIKGEPDGCYSEVGLNGGPQLLNLAVSKVRTGCFKIGSIVHEFLHALGFYHMQSTHDRDDYVKILWDNILPEYASNFKKYTTKEVSNLGVPYDYGSVLHYSEYGFSINGNKTIEPIMETSAKIGQREEMTESDILKLNILYSC